MMSDNLSTIFPNASIDFAGIYLDSHQVFSIVGALTVLPTVWLRDLSLLSYLSGFSSDHIPRPPNFMFHSSTC